MKIIISCISFCPSVEMTQLCFQIVHPSIHPILMRAISQEHCEGIS